MAAFRIGAEELATIDRTLVSLAQAGPNIELRFENHWTTGSVAPGILNAALMGSLSELKLKVDVEGPDATDKLLRFGVASALWRRDTPVEFGESADGGPLDDSSLGATWTVGARAVDEALFAEEAQPAGAFGPDHATFVNAHLSSGEDGELDVLFLIERWLYDKFEPHGAAGEALVDAVEIVLGELIANVHEHAGRRGVQSLIRVAVDADALRLTVTDTGVGICSSLTSKIDRPLAEGHGHDQSPASLLGELLRGELDPWHRGRGIGFSRVRHVVEGRSGRFYVACGRCRASSNDGFADVEMADYRLSGSVVDVTLPLPD